MQKMPDAIYQIIEAESRFGLIKSWLKPFVRYIKKPRVKTRGYKILMDTKKHFTFYGSFLGGGAIFIERTTASTINWYFSIIACEA